MRQLRSLVLYYDRVGQLTRDRFKTRLKSYSENRNIGALVVMLNMDNENVTW